MLSKILFKQRPGWILTVYRVVYPLCIVWQLVKEKTSLDTRISSIMYQPISLFRMLAISAIKIEEFNFFFYLLIGCLILLSMGIFPRFAAFFSMLLFVWIIGTAIGGVSGENPDYVPWNHAIVVFNLFILIFASRSIFFSKKNFYVYTDNWPIFLLKFNLVFAYFAGGLAKLQYGLDWINGYTLQGYLIYSHLHLNTPAVLPIIKSIPLLAVLSAIVLAVEVLFPLSLFNSILAVFFISGSILFQMLFYHLIDLRWMEYFGWSYLIYLLELIAFLHVYLSKRYLKSKLTK